MLRFFLSHDTKLLKILFLGVKMSRFCQLLRSIIMEVMYLYCMMLYHSQTRCHVIMQGMDHYVYILL